MARIYAEDTKVPIHQSINEIERLVLQSGHSGFQYGDAGHTLAIMFASADRRVRFTLPFGERPAGGAALSKWEQKRRARARALALTIKAKFVSVAAEIETFEEAFLAETVMPDGRTVIEHAGPLVLAAYNSGTTPPALLPDFSKDSGRG
jgi:hypothetical protein